MQNININSSLHALLIVCFLCNFSTAQVLPEIISLTKSDYKAQNQNWDLHEDQNGFIYASNTSCLIRYDGINWKQFPKISEHIIRCVATDNENKIYVGGFETFGYFSLDENHRYAYTNLMADPTLKNLKGEEIWQILATENGIYFQSFSKLFRILNDHIEEVTINGNIMYVQEFNGVVLIPTQRQGVITLSDKQTIGVSPDSLPYLSPISTILNIDQQTRLVGTKNHGLYIFKDGKRIAWKKPINDICIQYQLNKATRIDKDLIAFGTILNGLYITDDAGNILQHFNTKSGLQNNTVLDILIDQQKNIWCALDHGIDNILRSSPLLYFKDRESIIGSTYAAQENDGAFYIGSNQGIFRGSLNPSKETSFTLVPHSQGQVWDLKEINGELYCAHNRGLFKIKAGELMPVSVGLGMFTLRPDPFHPTRSLIGSYDGLLMMSKGEASLNDATLSNNKVARAVRQIEIIDSFVLTSHTYQGLNLYRHGSNTVLLEQLILNQPAQFANIRHRIAQVDSSFITINREGGDKGEYCAIFYSDEEWSAVWAKTKWLSPTPDTFSMGWDAVCPRILTFGMFVNKTNDTVIVGNTHFDHVGKVARTESAFIIKNLLDPYTRKYPVILLGDFNMVSSDLGFEPINDLLDDAYLASTETTQSNGTFNGFNINEAPTRRIDYIFYNKNRLVVLDYTAPIKKINGRHISDHFPIVVNFNIK